jgi:hypothetical protein
MDLISETPWWLPTSVAMLGVILFVTGNNRRDKNLRFAGVSAIGLALLLAVVSYLLESDREVCVRQTKELAAAIDKRDWNAMDNLLSPDVSFMYWRGRRDLVEGTKWAATHFDLKSLRLTGLEANQVGRTINVGFQAGANFQDAPVTITNWKVGWEKSGNRWLMTNIDFLGGPGMGESVLQQTLPRRPPGGP